MTNVKYYLGHCTAPQKYYEDLLCVFITFSEHLLDKTPQNGSVTTPSWTTAPAQLPSDFCPPDSYPWVIPPWITFPQSIIPYEIPPAQLPTESCPQTIIPEWFPRGNCPPDKYPMKMYINNRNTKEWVKLMIYGNKTNWSEKIIWINDIFI